MKILDSFRSALQSLIVNKLRSSLTMLGVIIGVASVIAMVAVGNGTSQQVQQSVLSLGSNLITVTPGTQTDAGLRGAGPPKQTLTLDDMNALRDQLGDTIRAITAEQRAGRWQVVHGALNWNSQVVGVTPEYPLVRDWPLAEGEFITDADLSLATQVAVLGSVTAQNLFGDGSPIGLTFQFRQVFTDPRFGSRARIINFKVIGVLETKGSTFGFSRDDQILVPTTTAQRVLQGRTTTVDQIVMKGESSETMNATTADVQGILQLRHKIADQAALDFTVTNQNDTLAALGNITATFTLLLGAIGGISLLVGGIGIMNIMLVSVNERTREIGIRKAVGARKADILSQFLIEAIALTGIGGILGITLGWGITEVVHQIQPTLLVIITAGTIIIAVGVSVAIGVVFGLYPAMRAAGLQVVQALRYE